MSQAELVEQAIEQLYRLDPSDFIDRRQALVAAARRAGEPAAATQIGQLRRPTRGAWTVNVLARSDPELLAQLVELGEQLREAEHDLDGEQLRELSRQRRTLVDSLARKAFTATGQRAPSAAVRDEVVATLSAALADTAVAEQLRSGRLVRPARWDGFGVAAGPDLALVARPAHWPQPPDQRPEPADRQTARTERQQRREAEREKAAAAVAEAQRALATAESAEAAREGEVRELDEAARLIKEQQSDARRHLDEARVDVRYARAQLSKAEQQLRRV